MKYITFFAKMHDIGGLGHSFTDYLTAFIISNIFDDVKFINQKLLVTKQIRNMNVNNNNFDWNSFLNLKLLGNYEKINISKIHKISNQNKKYKSIDIKKIYNFLVDEKINFLVNNNRIYLFDLYYFELHNIVPKNTTYNIVKKLKTNFYLKHNKKNKEKKIINIYLRRGDFQKNHSQNFKDKFIYNSLKKITEIINLNEYTVNIISAGTDIQMNDIKNDFNYFKNINYLFNQKQEEVFYLMTQSDILLFFDSSFPFTASLFCDGLIIKKKNDNYFTSVIKYKNYTFLDNYIITDELETKDLDKINNFL